MPKALKSAADALRGEDAERTGPTIEAPSPMIERLEQRPSAGSAAARRPSCAAAPNSVVRCATVIEKVLKMMNAPTNSAMPANASSSVLRKLRLLWMSSDWSFASSRAGLDVDGRGSSAAQLRVTLLGARARSATATSISSSLPRLSADPLRLAAASRTAIVAPPKADHVAELARGPRSGSASPGASAHERTRVADLQVRACRRCSCRSSTSFGARGRSALDVA